MLSLRAAQAVSRCSSKITTVSSGRSFARRNATTHSDAPHGHHPHGPTEEKFGKGYFITIAALVGAVAFYNFEQSLAGDPSKSALTRLIDKYAELQSEIEEKNTRRTELIQQAANDRLLLSDSKPSRVIPMRFPEELNGGGSPWNNEAGWSRSI